MNILLIFYRPSNQTPLANEKYCCAKHSTRFFFLLSKFKRAISLLDFGFHNKKKKKTNIVDIDLISNLFLSFDIQVKSTYHYGNLVRPHGFTWTKIRKKK